MDNKECEVCSKMVKEKYKHYKTWKVLAIVFIFLSVLFAILFFANGNLFVSKTNENEITIRNGSGVNSNNVITGDGSTMSGTVKNETNIGVFIIIGAIILAGGVGFGCYNLSKNKKHKPNNDN